MLSLLSLENSAYGIGFGSIETNNALDVHAVSGSIRTPPSRAGEGRKRPVSGRFAGVSESLTSGESLKKETPGLYVQNRRMLAGMSATLKNACACVRLQLTLSAALLLASATNVALVCAWL